MEAIAIVILSLISVTLAVVLFLREVESNRTLKNESIRADMWRDSFLNSIEALEKAKLVYEGYAKQVEAMVKSHFR